VQWANRALDAELDHTSDTFLIHSRSRHMTTRCRYASETGRGGPMPRPKFCYTGGRWRSFQGMIPDREDWCLSRDCCRNCMRKKRKSSLQRCHSTGISRCQLFCKAVRPWCRRSSADFPADFGFHEDDFSIMGHGECLEKLPLGLAPPIRSG